MWKILLVDKRSVVLGTVGLADGPIKMIKAIKRGYYIYTETWTCLLLIHGTYIEPESKQYHPSSSPAHVSI